MSNPIEEIEKAHKLFPNPLGGFMEVTYESPIEVETVKGKRVIGSGIVHLYKFPDFFPFHVQDSDEILFHHKGGPHKLCLIYPNSDYKEVYLGSDYAAGHVAQFTIPKDVYQAHFPVEEYSFISAIVLPGWHEDDSRDFSAEEMIAKFPQHAEIIKKLSKR